MLSRTLPIARLSAAFHTSTAAAAASPAASPAAGAVLRRALTATSANTMRAVVVEDWCKAEDLKVVRCDVPDIMDGCVRVQVMAAGANFFDILQVAGKYQLKPPLPFVPGAEFAGIVTEVASDVSSVKIGDKVFGGLALGCYAEQVVVSAEMVLPLPKSMSFRDAAGIFVTFPTAYAGLVTRGQLKAGEVCLVHAAAGGVGVAAIQISKAVGATVVAAVGSADKFDVCKRTGADIVINYSSPDWVNDLKTQLNGRGVDVVFDPVGLALDSTKVMAWNGRYIVVGFAGGKIPELALNRVLLKNISVVGLHWGAYTQNEAHTVPVVWRAILDLIDAGKLRSVVYPKNFSLEELPAALAAIEKRQTYGKVVVDVGTAAPSRL